MTTLYHLNLSRTGEAALDPFMGETPVSPSQKAMTNNLLKCPQKVVPWDSNSGWSDSNAHFCNKHALKTPDIFTITNQLYVLLLLLF